MSWRVPCASHVAARPVGRQSHARVRSATRSTALRERGLRAISASPAFIARPTSASGDAGQRVAVRIGSRAVAGSPANGRRGAGEEALDDAVLERMEADHGEPAARAQAAARCAGGPSDTSDSSRFTKIRRAWNVRVAGS